MGDSKENSGTQKSTDTENPETTETEAPTADTKEEKEEKQGDSVSKASLGQNPDSVSVDDDKTKTKTKTRTTTHVDAKTEASEPVIAMPVSATKSEPHSEKKEGHGTKNAPSTPKPTLEPADNGVPTSNSKQSYFEDDYLIYEGSESGTEDDQSNFMKELELFFRERTMEFKPPKFYGEGLNCLKSVSTIIVMYNFLFIMNAYLIVQ